MELSTLIFLATGLAMDSFAVAISAGTALKRFKARRMLQISITFAVCQGLMPVAGWLMGYRFVESISSYDHWVVFALLSLIGGKMIYEACQESDDSVGINIDSRRTIFLLGLATSIDALAVGFSFSLLDIAILQPALIIGLTTLLFSFSGLFIGLNLGRLLKNKVEFLGGLILIGIAFKMLLSHLLV